MTTTAQRRRNRVDTAPISEAEWSLMRPHLSDLWQAYFDLLWETGLRPSEALAITSDDIAQEASGSWWVDVKRLKRRDEDPWDRVRVSPALAQRMIGRTNRQSKRPFPRTMSAAQLALRNAAEKAGVRDSVHPHLFRHSFGRRLAKSDWGLSAIEHLQIMQQLLGHKSAGSTQVYLEPGPEEVREAWDRLHAAPSSGEQKPEPATPLQDVMRKALGL